MTTTGSQGQSDKVFRVLFVCTGNTCRTPMAEGILKKIISELPTLDVQIDVASAGTMGLNGHPATGLAVAVAAEYGVDILSHQSQGVTPQLLAQSDLIFTMAAEHFETCRKLGASPERLFMLKGFPARPGDLMAASIADPIGGDEDQYESAFLEIDEAIRHAVPAILKHAGVSSTPR